jgi:hypothetical protein
MPVELDVRDAKAELSPGVFCEVAPAGPVFVGGDVAPDGLRPPGRVEGPLALIPRRPQQEPVEGRA